MNTKVKCYAPKKHGKEGKKKERESLHAIKWTTFTKFMQLTRINTRLQIRRNHNKNSLKLTIFHHIIRHIVSLDRDHTYSI